MKKFLAIVVAVVSLSAPAFAHGGSKFIHVPHAHKGEFSGKVKNSYLLNDKHHEDSWNSAIVGEYGITDYWQTEVGVIVGDAGRGHDPEAKSIMFENVIRLAQPGEYWIDPGLMLTYTHSIVGTADDIGAKIILSKKFEKWDHAINAGLGREVGEDSSNDTKYNFAYGVNYKLNDKIKIGAEWYSDFGTFKKDFHDQNHQFGPVVSTKILGVGVQAGVLGGVSDHAPNAEAKMSFDFHF